MIAWLTAGYLLVALLMSMPFALHVEQWAHGKRLDAEDFGLVFVMAIFWPLTLLLGLWWEAYRAYRTAATEARLRRYGATAKEDPRRG